MKIQLAAIFAVILAVLSGGSCGKQTQWENVSADSKSESSERRTNSKTVLNGNYAKNLPEGFAEPTDDVAQRVVREYGAVFVAKGDIVVPKSAVFKDENEVTAFQSGLESSTDTIGGVKVELQKTAMDALRNAVAEAEGRGLKITPRGEGASKRNYLETVDLWASRVNPGLLHWVEKGRLSQAEADRIRQMAPFEQVSEILKLENRGMYFSKDLSKTIMASVAPPGTSQHLTMLAIDVSEFENAEVRSILARNRWFQTVVSDLPHFTYLGVEEPNLPNLGLKKTQSNGRAFWIPDMNSK